MTDSAAVSGGNVPASFREVISLWATRKAMASATGAPAGLISKWWQRGKIPSEWWSTVAGTEVARANGVTEQLLSGFVSRRVEPAPEARP